MRKKETNAGPYLGSDPAHLAFQYLEDLATGYWYAQVLFTAVEIKLFGAIEDGCTSPAEIGEKCGCKTFELSRLLVVLQRMDLIHRVGDDIFNSQLARRFLVPDAPDYMGDFILYRRYMQARWDDLTGVVADPDRPVQAHLPSLDDDYKTRNFYYVRAMDRLARLKAKEIVSLLDPDGWCGPVLDVGGGAGALGRALVQSQEAAGRLASATLFELPEVIAAARRIYPEEKEWRHIEPLEGDFRNHVFAPDACYNLVLLSNFLHAYARETACDLLFKAVSLTDPDGVLLIHDYFPDRSGNRPHKGAMYDLNMMINTFDGACQPSETLLEWLRKAGMRHCTVLDLESDSSIILASRHKEVTSLVRPEKRDGLSLDGWEGEAMRIGFAQARIIPVGRIHTAAWSREKCRFGCKGYGKNHMCPPGGIDHATMTTLLKEYAWALLVVDTPPGKTFHDKLLALERKAFLAGHYKALAFGAGPCPVCPTCAADTACRHTELARPSMEGSGIDVYATAHDAGIPLEPLTEVGRYVKYLGMVLIK